MKKIIEVIKHYKKIAIAACLLIVIGVGVTIAYLHGATSTLTNTFASSDIDTEINEDTSGVIGTKKPSIENIGKSDCLVRMRVNISPSAAEQEISLLMADGTEISTTDWKFEGDSTYSGWYYYQDVLKAKPTEPFNTPNLFEHVVINDKEYTWNDDNDTDDQQVWSEFLEEYPDFSITLYQEACPISITVDGEVISAVNADGTFNATNAEQIWAAYDEKNNQ